MVRLFIFDMGGVLVRNFDVLPAIASHVGLTEEALLQSMGDDFMPLMEGTLSGREFWSRFSQRSGIALPEQGNLLIDLYNPSLDVNTANLIRRLKGFCPVVCGTNTMTEHYSYHLENGDYRVFDTVYASHLMGVAKPKPAFYRWILDREQVRPEEAVFADDMPVNIETARSIGIHSFLYSDADAFEHDLTRAGLVYS